MSDQIEPITLFYSYAREDEALRNQLGKHLSSLEQQGLITGWYDRCVSPGKQWSDEISTHLITSRIILLLISPDFINSGYCMSVEMKEAIKLHEAGKARVIPILLRSADCEGMLFSKLQSLPKDAKPVMEASRRDRVLAQIAKDIRRVVEELSTTIKQSQAKGLPIGYTVEQFESDVNACAAHLAATLQRLKISGVIPKDRGDKNEDPELHGIFVPLRTSIRRVVGGEQITAQKLEDKPSIEEKQQNSLIHLMEQNSHVVLLGGPGSGKSTVIRHLTWCHAVIHCSNVPTTEVPFLSGKPIPLRIELRRFSEDRKHRPNYNFLSYTAEMFERNNIKINPYMLEALLEQQRMLLLFDGLDEVATLDERQRLVEEIENFTLHYSGNRIIVTSRPVGYELASCSKQLFAHADVQNFDDEQIYQFLKRWYTHVLRLSPIPYEELQELEALFKTLKENTRLHKLAENPLLLTVITALYRSARLPDKRVQVYDKCAELLLETWAKLKGTDIRWKEMKMVKEDQYACVAHLGYVLHKRAQQDEKTTRNSPTEDTAVDVPARFLQKEIEIFLASKRLITEVAEQRLEARRFLDLIRIEAGLIVERGTDENNEPLYGFMHRTFQEYFAAVDVYEHYQQEEDPIIISTFLEQHLHHAHWREVILLLLGKLKSKPVTNQLRKFLDGGIKGHYSQYTELIQHNLFFVCQCLVEEISVEIEFAELVVSRLSHLVKHAQFPSQRTDALENLGKMVLTRQYTSLASRKLTYLLGDSSSLDTSFKIDTADVLLKNSLDKSEGKAAAIQTLLLFMQRSDLPIGQIIRAAKILYEASPVGSDERMQASQFLLQLTQRPDLPVGQTMQAAQALYEASPAGSVERKQAGRFLLQLIQRSDLSVGQTIQAIEAILKNKAEPLTTEEQLAVDIFLQLTQRSDFPAEQIFQAAEAMRYIPQQREPVGQFLLQFIQRPDLSTEQVIQITRTLYTIKSLGSEEHKQAFVTLQNTGQNQNLDINLRLQALTALIVAEVSNYAKKAQAIHMILRLNQKELVQHYLEKEWRVVIGTFNITDIPFLAEIAQQEVVPSWVRNCMYSQLHKLLS